jgi:antitoxin component YwqK of YwqJK toxin-antitoxin module
MKAILLSLAIPLLMVGCGNSDSKPDLTNTAPEKDPMESAVEWSKLQNRNGDAYIPNTDKPYSGWAKQTSYAQVIVLAEFTDGSVTRLKQWQQNGIPKWDIGYSKGKVSLSDVPLGDFSDSNYSFHHGLFTEWYDNGQKKWEGNGKGDGLLTFWYENGQKEAEGNYKDGKKDGLWTEWYENGQKRQEANYKDDKKDGLKTWWYENGQKADEINYKYGKKNGLVIMWYKNGQKEAEGNFKDGKENGLFIKYNKDGTVRRHLTVKNGEIVKD